MKNWEPDFEAIRLEAAYRERPEFVLEEYHRQLMAGPIAELELAVRGLLAVGMTTQENLNAVIDIIDKIEKP